MSLVDLKPPSKRVLMKMFADIDKSHDYIYAAYASLLARDDSIITKKGKGTQDYYDLMVDSDSVLAGLVETRISAVTGLEWDVHPPSEDDADLLFADFITWGLNQIGNFESVLKEIAGACRTGYSITEIIWEEAVYEGVTKLIPKLLIPRRPERFRFDKDYNLLLLTDRAYAEGVKVPPMKFIHHSFQPRYYNPYGTSLLRAVWWPWWFKHYAFKWWLQAAERGAVITPVGFYPETFTPNERTEFANALKLFLGNKYIAAKEGSKIDFPHIKIDPNFCKGLVDSCDSQMRHRILGASLSSGTEGSGSRALGTVHNERLQERVESDAKELMSSINRQLIQWMILINFPEPETMPEWKLNYEPPKDIKTTVESLKFALESSIPISVSDAAELLQLPMAQEGDDILELQKPEPQFPQQPPPQDREDEEVEVDDDVVDEESTASCFASRQASVVVDNRGRKYRKNAEKLVRYATLKGMPVYDNFGVQIHKWLGRMMTLDTAYIEAQSFRLDYEMFGDYLTDARFFALMRGYHDVYDLARVKRFAKSTGQKKFKMRPWETQHDSLLAKLTAAKTTGTQWDPLPSDETIERFMDREVLTRQEFDMYHAAVRRESFTAAQMSAQTIEKKLRPAIVKVMEEGATLREFQREVDNIVMSPAHAETIFRTNLQTAYNNGHAEAILSPLLAPIIPAFEYDALLDNRTTPICEERNGQVYSRDELVLYDVVPPAHFNCRSTIVEVFLDEWNGKTSLPPTIPAQHGFGRYRPYNPRQMPPIPTPGTKPVIVEPPRSTAGISKPTIKGKIPKPTAEGNLKSSAYEKPWKSAPDKLPGTTDRAQAAVPQYSKQTRKQWNRAYKGTAKEQIEYGGPVSPTGKVSSLAKGDDGSVTIDITDLKDSQRHKNATFHTHPDFDTSFSATDIETMIWSDTVDTEIVLAEKYVYIGKAAKNKKDLISPDFLEEMEDMMQELIAKDKKRAVSINGYYTNQDFADSIHKFWLQHAESVGIEYQRIPVSEFDGLLGWNASAIFEWVIHKIQRPRSEREMISKVRTGDLQGVDDSKLIDLFNTYVDYIVVDSSEADE